MRTLGRAELSPKRARDSSLEFHAAFRPSGRRVRWYRLHGVKQSNSVTGPKIAIPKEASRRQTPSVGIYSHVLAGWGIFYAQPFVLNDRQVGVAIEGVLREEAFDIAQLAVDTHGHTDVGMAVSDGTGFDMCPRLKALKDRHLYLPRGCEVAGILKSICEANLDFDQVPMHWD